MKYIGKVIQPLFFILLGIGLVMLFWQGCRKEAKQVLDYWEVEGFRTDTIIKNRYYETLVLKIDTFEKVIPPKIVTIYKSGQDKYIVIQCDDDSLITLIDSMGNKIAVLSQDFITIAPTTSKLLEGVFSKTLLTLTMLNSNGQTYKLGYTTNYKKFTYQFIGDSLRTNKIPKQGWFKKREGKDKQFRHGFYISPGYSILDNKLTGSLDYLIQFRRFQGDLEARIIIDPNPELIIHAKIGVKLNR